MSVLQDLRFASRLLRKDRAFTAAAVLSLALGIGANTAIFSLIDTLMLRPLPVRNPEQLVELVAQAPGDPRMNFFWWKFYEHFRDENHVFVDLVGISPARFQVSGDGFDAETVYGEYVVGGFFPALGVRPAIGRLIEPADDQLGVGDPAIAVVSWSYWQNRFKRSPSILNQRILVNGVPATVVGVTPREFSGVQVGLTPNVWVPAAMEPMIQHPSRRADGTLGLALMARLRPGVSIEQARAEMRVLDRVRVEELAKRSNDPAWRQSTFDVLPAAAGLSALRDQLARPLLMLMAMVALLLLIACTNVASLLLARATARRREMDVRVALGAGRPRLIMQLLTESLLLSAAGGLLGAGPAYFGANALVRSWLDLRPGAVPFDVQVQPDLRVLLFAASVAVLTGVLFGLAPAWNAFSSAASSLRETGAAGETKSRRLFGGSLVVAQVALSVVLLGAAALFARHLSSLRHADLGFDRDAVLLVTLDPARSGYSPDQLFPMYQDLLGRLEAIPGVRSAAIAAHTPIERGAASRFLYVEGAPPETETRRRVSLDWVSPTYFDTLGTPRLAGRDFARDEANGPRVAIVNQALARHYFGDGSAIGKRFTFDEQRQPYEIVGVVGDAKYSTLREPAPRTVYLHAFQELRGRFSQFAIRTAVPPARLVGDVRRVVGDALKTVPIAKITTLADQVDGSTKPERLIAVISSAFGAVAAALAAIGLYGLLAYTVARRTPEIAVRMALGATVGDIRTMVLKSAGVLVATGVATGVPIAWWARGFAAAMVDGLTAPQVWPIVAAGAGLATVAMLAAFVPARRAARVQPMDALRQ